MGERERYKILMDKNLPLLKVRLFGSVQITYGDTLVFSERSSITKVIKLFLILLFNYNTGITRGKLLEDLFGSEDMADVSNSLRVTMHRLKKMLQDAGLPEHDYVCLKDGVYYWDSPFEVEVDVKKFKQLIADAECETDRHKKSILLKEACQIYAGEFLQKLSGDEWVLIERVQCKKLYSCALQQHCELLMAEKKYGEILQVVDPACTLYPFDDWQVYKIEAYIAMNCYKDALKEYEMTAKLLFEELGVSPSKRMLEQFSNLSEHIRNRPQEIGEIKDNLQENAREKGAFFCTFPGFRDAYRMMRRGMERSGQSVFLVVCTLTDSKGQPMEESEKLEEMSMELHRAIKGSLRSSDSFTKYNKAQYLVMLVGTNEENCQIAIRRIVDNFSNVHKAWAERLECSVSSLLDILE